MALIPSCSLCLAVCDAQSFLTSCEHFFCGRCVRRLQHPALRSFRENGGCGDTASGPPFSAFGEVDSASPSSISLQSGLEKLPPSAPVCPVCKAKGYQLLPITNKNLRPLFEDTSAAMERNQRVVSAQLRHYRQIHRRMTEALKVLNTNYRTLEKNHKAVQQELKDTKETLRTLQQYAAKQKQEIDSLSFQKTVSDPMRSPNSDYFLRSSQGGDYPPRNPYPPRSPHYPPSREDQYASAPWEKQEAFYGRSGDSRVYPPSQPPPKAMSADDAPRYSYPYRSPQQIPATPPCPPLQVPSSPSSAPPLGWAATSSMMTAFKRSREGANNEIPTKGRHNCERDSPHTATNGNSSSVGTFRGVHSPRRGVTECSGDRASSLSGEGERGGKSMPRGYQSISPSPLTVVQGAAQISSGSRTSSGAGSLLSAQQRHYEAPNGHQKSFVSATSSPSPSWRSTASPLPLRPIDPVSRMLVSPMAAHALPMTRQSLPKGGTRQ